MSLSQDIINEVYFLFSSILMGIIITFAYDFLLIIRRIVRHNLFFISLEDLIFWMVCAITVFYMLYKENNGILRWFAVFGAALGMLLYKKTIGNHFVHIVSVCIQKEIELLGKIVGFIWRPVKRLLQRIGKLVGAFIRKQKKLARYAKKKLTILIKMLKMTVCKH